MKVLPEFVDGSEYRVRKSAESWQTGRGMLPELVNGRVGQASLRRFPKNQKDLVEGLRFAFISDPAGIDE